MHLAWIVISVQFFKCIPVIRKSFRAFFSHCNISGVRRQDVSVVELHDCFSANELITYEALGLCEPGKAGEFIDRGDNTYGGKFVVNPSGGLISKGHPLGATGELLSYFQVKLMIYFGPIFF